MKLHRIMASALIVMSSFSAAGSLSTENSLCPVAGDNAAEMYDYFWRTAYEYTGVDKEGNPTAVMKEIPIEQGRKAWACIEKAANLGSCDAINIMWLYHSYSIMPDNFGLTPNPEMGKKYESIHIRECRKDQNS